VFGLDDNDLKTIRCIRKYDPYDDIQEKRWYYLRDAWEKATSKYGVEYVEQKYKTWKGKPMSYEALYGWRQTQAPISASLWDYTRQLSKWTRKDGSEVLVVQRAIVANSMKVVFMCGFWYVTQSWTLWAEVLRSCGDLFNQMTLLLSLRFATLPSDHMHPYGYGSGKWGFNALSGGIVCLFGMTALFNGIQDLWSPSMPHHLYWGVAMCVGSALFDTYSFIPAYRLIRDKAKIHQTSFFDYLRNGTDSTSVHVLAEDGAGVVCSILAVSCMIATHQTGLTLFDALGSISIGLFVTAVGTSLFWRNMRLLTGRSLPSDVMGQVLKILQESEMVGSYHDIKSLIVGPDACVLKVEVDYNADRIANKHMDANDMLAKFQEAIAGADHKAHFHDLMMKCCADYQSWLTIERTKLETDIKNIIRKYGYHTVHVDIENY
ncbi:cation efflux family protein / metal tolerance protein (MTPc4), partial [Reticulomyxa filosa]